MTTLIELREEVAQSLTDHGLTAMDYIPERIQPPTAIVAAGEPYVEQGDTFCSFIVRLDVTLIAGKATNIKTTDELDDLILTAIEATGGWTIEQVGQPFQLQANNAHYLATRMTLVQETNLERNDA